MQKEEAKGGVLRGGEGKHFSTPFAEKSLQGKESRKVCGLVFVKREVVHKRHSPLREVEFTVTPHRLKPLVAVETQRANLHRLIQRIGKEQAVARHCGLKQFLRGFRARGSRFCGRFSRGRSLGGGAGEIQFEQTGQDFVFAEIGGPPVDGGNCRI